MPSNARIGLIGIGNTLATDDGAGIQSLGLLRDSLADDRIALVECERGGMALLELLEGFDAAILLDAAQTGYRVPGEVEVFSIRSPFTPGACPSLHTINLRGLLAFGEALGMALPREVTVVSVEARDIETFHEGCTREVEHALREMAEKAHEQIRRVLPDVRLGSRPGSRPDVGGFSVQGESARDSASVGGAL